MIETLPALLAFTVVWTFLGGAIGLAMIVDATSPHCIHRTNPWCKANWAQRFVLGLAFGPVFWVMAPLIYLWCFHVGPRLEALWRWLGTL
jgi:hypothetical protein